MKLGQVETTAEELVRNEYPGAMAHKSGHRWYIHFRVPCVRHCPECKRREQSEELSLSILGSGSTISSAWESAAKKLGSP